LIDDISVTMSNVAPGTVNITNNLSRAQYILSGPLQRRGVGSSAVFTNAPPGDYILEYVDLPYYQSPPAATNYLAPGGSITFRGNYTFADTNHNGISDSWELAYFGNVTSRRTALTDSDGDGLSDLAEFLAGTDPLSPAPRFPLKWARVGTQAFGLEWPTTPGNLYRIQSSTNLLTWKAATSWMEATSNVSRVELPLNSPAQWLRAQIFTRTNGAGQVPAVLAKKLQTAASAGHVLNWTSPSGLKLKLKSSRGVTRSGAANLPLHEPISDAGPPANSSNAPLQLRPVMRP